MAARVSDVEATSPLLGFGDPRSKNAVWEVALTWLFWLTIGWPVAFMLLMLQACSCCFCGPVCLGMPKKPKSRSNCCWRLAERINARCKLWIMTRHADSYFWKSWMTLLMAFDISDMPYWSHALGPQSEPASEKPASGKGPNPGAGTVHSGRVGVSICVAPSGRKFVERPNPSSRVGFGFGPQPNPRVDGSAKTNKPGKPDPRVSCKPEPVAAPISGSSRRPLETAPGDGPSRRPLSTAI
ncbi:hypothetical protein M885DRAFT_154220 [Pelagophyceae sp. CCMP2097]|nr:hypothetical protein M885DRAFT_154220 [Pelagophyceae sp. CCMP2097]